MYSVFCQCCESVINYERKIYALVKNKLSRNRKFPFEDIVNYTIANRGKTNVLEAEDFAYEKYGDWNMVVSKQDISQQRMNLNPIIFKDMNTDSLKQIYDSNESSLKKFKGHYVCGIDGSILELPNHKITKIEFDVPPDSLTYTQPSRARVSGFLDLKNEFMLDSIIETTKIGERRLALENINNVSNIIDLSQAICIFDRGYPSIELFLTLMEKNAKFIVRLKSTDYEKQRAKMKKDDEWIKIPLNKTKTNKIKNSELRKKAEKKTHLKSRVVNVVLDNGEVETLITNLPKKVANQAELKMLYNERWKIETDFDVLKNKLDIENFSGIKRVIIEQDFYSQIFMHNLLNEYRIEINKKIKEDKEKEGVEKEYKTNVSHLAGRLKNNLLKILYADTEEEKRKINDYILKRAEKNLIPIKKKKPSPSRGKNKKRNKNPPNLRKNF